MAIGLRSQVAGGFEGKQGVTATLEKNGDQGMQIGKNRLMILFLALLFAPLCHAQAANVYISQGGGTFSGGSACNGQNTQTPAWFNNGGNWGNGSAQIGPGTTVWLCGTFTDSTPGDTLLSFQGSGKSGSPITVKFDTGATLTNTAYWSTGEAMSIYGKSYTIVDGGSNGLIQNTGNGSSLPNQATSAGLRCTDCTNSTARNLTVANIYVHSSAGDSLGHSQDTGGIIFTETTNNTISNNTIHDAGNCIVGSSDTSSETGFAVTNNTVYHCNWGILLTGNANQTMTGATITGNQVYDAYVWDDAADSAHHNGIHLNTSSSSALITGTAICGNWVHGNFGLNNTGWVYIDALTPYDGSESGNIVCNNLLANEANTGPNNGFVTDAGVSTKIVNNTMYLVPGDCADPGPGAVYENNICVGAVTAIRGDGFTFALVDYNVYYNIQMGWTTGSSCGCMNFSSWQSTTGWDAHSTTSNPQLNTGSTPPYQLTSASSSVAQTTANLYNNPAALNVDYLGLGRPSSGSWLMGAYYNSSSANQPVPPTGLSATVQ